MLDRTPTRHVSAERYTYEYYTETDTSYKFRSSCGTVILFSSVTHSVLGYFTSNRYRKRISLSGYNEPNGCAFSEQQTSGPNKTPDKTTSIIFRWFISLLAVHILCIRKYFPIVILSQCSIIARWICYPCTATLTSGYKAFSCQNSRHIELSFFGFCSFTKHQLNSFPIDSEFFPVQNSFLSFAHQSRTTQMGTSNLSDTILK